MSLFSKCISSIVLTIVFGLGILQVQADQPLDRAIVVVNDVPITISAVKERAKLMKKDQALEHTESRHAIVRGLIIDEIMFQIAKRAGMDLNATELNQQIEYAIQSQAIPPEFSKNKEKLKKQFVIESIQQNMLSQAAHTVTEEEIQEQMEHLPTQLQQGGSIRFHLETLVIPFRKSHSKSFIERWKLKSLCALWRKITFSSQASSSHTVEQARQTAEQILEQAKGGLSFQQLIEKNKQKSLWKIEKFVRTADKLPPSYRKALSYLKPKGVAGPFEFYNGFHLIRLEKISGPQIIQARHIFIKDNTEVDAETIKQRLEAIRKDCLRDEKEFVKQVERHSEDPDTIFKGGDLGWILPGALGKSFEKVLELLEPGQISLPFKTAKGWHIVQVKEKQFLTPTHPEWKRYAAKRLVEEKKTLEALENIQKELYLSAHIEWVDPMFKSV